MKTENELIAEFMGGVLKKGQYTLPDRPVNQYTDEYGYAQETYDWSVSELLYHKSWDWLIPVVKKCEDISRQKQHDLDSPGKDLDDHNGWRAWSYHEPNLSTDLKSVYEQTVEFIRWYNFQNS